jgi:hypothetical protein
VRNWDIFAACLLRPVAYASPAGPGFGGLIGATERRRRSDLDQAKQAVVSERYTESMLRLLRWFVARGWRDQHIHRSTRESQRVRSTAARLLPKREELVYAGKVGTGFDQELLRRVGEKLARLETLSPFAEEGLPQRGVHWVKPKLIAQVGFTEWTAGCKLRHPRFLACGMTRGRKMSCEKADLR